MRGVREGLQPVLQPHHAHAQALRLQTLRLWTLREAVPAQGRLKEVCSTFVCMCLCGASLISNFQLAQQYFYSEPIGRVVQFFQGIPTSKIQFQARRVAAYPKRELLRGA